MIREGKIFKEGDVIKFDNARVIALLNEQADKIASNEMSKGPEISVSNETVVEPVNNMPNDMVSNETGSNFTNDVNSTDINIPEPIQNATNEAVVEESVNEQSNVFDTPQESENSFVQETPSTEQNQVNGNVENNINFANLKAQYVAISANIKELIAYQDRLIDEMSKFYDQEKIDKDTYANEIDDITKRIA